MNNLHRSVLKSAFAASLCLATLPLLAFDIPAGASRESLLVEPEFADALYGQVDRLYLNGFWKFKPELNTMELKKNGWEIGEKGEAEKKALVDNGERNGYFKSSFDDAKWDELPVPMAWNVCFAPKQNKSKEPFAGVGYYRKSFEVPASKKGLRAVAHFASVQTHCKVWINGELVAEHVNASEKNGPNWGFKSKLLLDDFSVDVSKSLNYGGRNVLALRVEDDGLPLVYGVPDDGGICGPVRLDFFNKVHMDQMRVAADPSTGSVRIEAEVFNANGTPTELALSAELTPFESKFYKPPVAGAASFKIDLGKRLIPAGLSKQGFAFSVARPVAWDINSPFLYMLRVTDGSAAPVGQVRIGFRKFEVSGERFLLNGSPLYMRGTNMEPYWEWNPRTALFNKSNFVREDMKTLKAANFNYIRVHNGPNAEIFYAICDELGLLTEDDYSPDTTPTAAGESRAEQIETTDLARHINEDGTPNAAEADTIKKWILGLHNHPCVAMFTAGNEIGFSIGTVNKEAQLVKYLDCFYDLVKANDLQKRPSTPSSGLTIWQWHLPVKADFLDFHSYANGNLGWADAGSENWRCYSFFKRIYGKVDKPLVNGECGAYVTDKTVRKDLAELFKNGRLDKPAYVKWADKVSSNTKEVFYHDYVARTYFIAFKGIGIAESPAKYKAAAAQMHFDYVQAMRRDMRFLEGFALQAVDAARLGGAGMDWSLYSTVQTVAESAAKARDSVEFAALNKSLAPLTLIPDLYDRHCFAGSVFSTKIFVFNDQFDKAEPALSAEASIANEQGASIALGKVSFEALPERGRAERALSLQIPATAQSGDYSLKLKLLKNGAVVEENAYPLFIQRKDAAFKLVACAKKVACFDGKAQLAAKALEAFGVNFAKTSSFDALDRFDVLVIGPDSVSNIDVSSGKKIREWLEKGGRVVCLEQSAAGPLPFAQELSILPAGPLLFADAIETAHPLLRDLKPWHFELWNGERKKVDGYWEGAPKAVCAALVMPMQEGVIVSGAATRSSGWQRNPKFGMVAGEAKVGKGLALFSQARACSRLETDPVATVYLRNLFEYALGNAWNGEKASPLATMKTARVSQLDPAKCFQIDISKQANKTFFDEKDGDKLGGWTDQGDNDMRKIPRGKQNFGGVAYTILDDAYAKPSCMILWGKSRDYFAKEISGIPVGRKASRLFFLQGSAWGRDGEKAAEYRVHYANGKTESVPVVVGKNVGDWWNPNELPEAWVAFSTQQEGGNHIGLYNLAWVNPHPDWDIESIDFVSALGSTVTICVAISGD